MAFIDEIVRIFVIFEIFGIIDSKIFEKGNLSDILILLDY